MEPTSKPNLLPAPLQAAHKHRRSSRRLLKELDKKVLKVVSSQLEKMQSRGDDTSSVSSIENTSSGSSRSSHSSSDLSTDLKLKPAPKLNQKIREMMKINKILKQKAARRAKKPQLDTPYLLAEVQEEDVPEAFRDIHKALENKTKRMVVIKKENTEYDSNLEEKRKAKMMKNLPHHPSYVLSSKLGVRVNAKRGYVDPLSQKLSQSNPVSCYAPQSQDASPVSPQSSIRSSEGADKESDAAKRGSTFLPELNQGEAKWKLAPPQTSKQWPRSNIVSQRRNRERFSPSGSAKGYRKKKKSPIDRWIDTLAGHKHQISSDRASLLPGAVQHHTNLRKHNSFANLNFDFIPGDKKGLTQQFQMKKGSYAHASYKGSDQQIGMFKSKSQWTLKIGHKLSVPSLHLGNI